MSEWRDGDIFHWSYKDEQPGDRSAFSRYHCKSMIGIVRSNGRLVDTYWSGLSDNVSFSREDAEEKLSLRYLANLADLQNVPEGMAPYYANGDIVNLNHANSTKGNFYIRKGAQRCPAKMREWVQVQREKALRDAEFARRRAEELAGKLAAIEAGQVNDLYL